MAVVALLVRVAAGVDQQRPPLRVRPERPAEEVDDVLGRRQPDRERPFGGRERRLAVQEGELVSSAPQHVVVVDVRLLGIPQVVVVILNQVGRGQIALVVPLVQRRVVVGQRGGARVRARVEELVQVGSCARRYCGIL